MYIFFQVHIKYDKEHTESFVLVRSNHVYNIPIKYLYLCNQNVKFLSGNCNFENDTCGWIVHEPMMEPGIFRAVCGVGGRLSSCLQFNVFQDGAPWTRQTIRKAGSNGEISCNMTIVVFNCKHFYFISFEYRLILVH